MHTHQRPYKLTYAHTYVRTHITDEEEGVEAAKKSDDDLPYHTSFPSVNAGPYTRVSPLSPRAYTRVSSVS